MKLVLALVMVLGGAAKAEEAPIFRFAIPSEPHSLDPTETVGFDSQHLLGNIFRGLYRVGEDGKLISEGAESCRRKDKLHLTCKLRALKFSDGSPVTSQDYLRSFQHLLSPESKTTEVELLMNIKNAINHHAGEKVELGIRAKSDRVLEFTFQKPDPEFEFKLASPLLFPFKETPTIARANLMPVNGPYMIKEWDKSKITLVPNKFFSGGHPHRPILELRFIPDETTLLNMFDTGRLDFIRRIPTLSIERYRKHSGFLARPLSRFDYLGFGPALKDYPELRRAMTETLNYEEFRKLFDSLSRPGCPSFPDSYSGEPVCYNFKPALLRPKKPEKRIRFVINQSGGDDLKRGAEWFQNQWKKSLNLETNIESIEGKVMLSEIRGATPDIFRLGVPLTRPTCLAALELFKSDSASNYVHIIDKDLDRLILKLEDATSPENKKIFCSRALTRLLDLHSLIPLGRFQFFMVLSEKFEGIEINELNHLNLSQLHPAPTSPAVSK